MFAKRSKPRPLDDIPNKPVGFVAETVEWITRNRGLQIIVSSSGELDVAAILIDIKRLISRRSVINFACVANLDERSTIYHLERRGLHAAIT